MNKLTDVVGRFHALDFDLCKSGGIVAFHFRTGAGKVIVTAALENFVSTCRGPRDSNLVRLPDYVPPVVAAPALESSEPFRKIPLKPYKSRLPAERLAKYRACAAAFATGRYSSKTECALKFGLVPQNFHSWHFAQLKLAEQGLVEPIAVEREPVRKPNGRML